MGQDYALILAVIYYELTGTSYLLVVQVLLAVVAKIIDLYLYEALFEQT